MGVTYTAIATVTVGSGGAANIEFTSIPQTYTDLKILISARESGTSANYAAMRINGNTTTYSYRSIEGNGATVGSYNSSNQSVYGVNNQSNYTASTFGSIEIYIPNYAGSNTKIWSSDAVTETNATTSYIDMIAASWNNTTAVTSLEILPGSGNFVQYSTAYLYGIKNS